MTHITISGKKIPESIMPEFHATLVRLVAYI